MNGRPLAGRHRSGRSRRAGAAVCSFVAWVLLVGCGTDSGGDGDRTEPTVEQLLDGVDLGDGWASVAPRQISPFPEAIRPPCPTDPDMPFVDVAEVIESEIENEQRRMGINLTVATFEGAAGESVAVQAAWERMDCQGSNFTQSTLDGLPAGVGGIRLAAQEGSLNQVILLRSSPDDVAFLIVSGDDDDPVEVARQLADNFAGTAENEP